MVKDYESHIGEKFGHLTILNFFIDETEKYNSAKRKYKCQCDCGQITNKRCNDVLRGATKSCATQTCKFNPRSSVNPINKYKQYINQKINHLTILDFRYVPNAENNWDRYQFQVQCDCGFIDWKRCNSIINEKINCCGRYECPYHTLSSSTAIENYKSYIGTRFGNITVLDVIYHPENDAHYRYQFKVECDCGNIVEKSINAFLTNKLFTCGFLDCPFGKTGQAIENYKSNIGNIIGPYKVLEYISDLNADNQADRHKFKLECQICKSISILPCQSVIYGKSQHCNNCKVQSNIEEEFKNWLIENNLEFKQHIKYPSLAKFQNTIEIDFLLNDKLGIELNGLITHSTTRTHHYIPFGGKPNTYHLNKLESAKFSNIDLIQFWNTEWIKHPDICKSIILHKLGKSPFSGYARKCIIKEIPRKEYVEFMENNHIQGPTNNEIYRIGLYYSDVLVSAMSFGTSRFNKNYEYELLRFCNILYTLIPGSASRLFKKFIKVYNPENIISYSDRRLFESGNLYSTLGFSFAYNSQINYWYFKNRYSDYYHKLEHRSNYMKHKLKDKLPNFDPNLTEFENMENNGYFRIYDCGNKVYTYKKKR